MDIKPFKSKIHKKYHFGELNIRELGLNIKTNTIFSLGTYLMVVNESKITLNFREKTCRSKLIQGGKKLSLLILVFCDPIPNDLPVTIN